MAAIVGGVVASVAGFGIGSLVTPVVSIDLGVKLAVAIVAIPHFVATAVRLWTLRSHVDRHVLLRFGLASAVGSLAGALLHGRVSERPLTIVLGVLLVVTGLGTLTGWSARLRLRGRAALLAGAVSGLLGGLVGNQGGVRSGALLSFGLNRQGFVATATAVALLVDIARTPVYAVTQGAALVSHWTTILWLATAVVAGTFVGRWLLARIPEKLFLRTVGVLVLLLGLYLLQQGARA